MKHKANRFSNRTNIKKIFINQYVIDCLLSLQDRLDKRLSSLLEIRGYCC